MLQSSYLSVLEATNREELKIELVRFATELGFDIIGASAVIDRFQIDPVFISVDNTPVGFVDAFYDRSHGKRDPVSQHCKINSAPIIWDQSTYVAVGQGERWEHQASFGYRCGISLALHLPAGRHFFFGVDRYQPLPKNPGKSRASSPLFNCLPFTPRKRQTAYCFPPQPIQHYRH